MELATRAYAGLLVKAVDEKRRTFSGWATTGATDRVGDTINPLGVTFTNPLVLLHQHDRLSPIGTATFSKPTAKGIQFNAEIPVVEEPGIFKDRVDSAWAELKYGVVRFVSIGFRPLKYMFNDDGGVDFDSVEVYELSPVSIPALPDAIVTAVKSMSGAPLSRETIQLIKNADRQSVGSIKLIQVKKSASGIPLVR